MKVYIYGGIIRDKVINIDKNPIDLDFICVIDDDDKINNETNGKINNEQNENWAFNYMIEFLKSKNFYIRFSSPEMWICKGYFKGSKILSKFAADFSLARKYDNSNKKIIGTLEDELSRKDFTINTLAKLFDIDNPSIVNNNQIIDIFDGLKHLQEKKFVTIIDPEISFVADCIRTLRIFRLSVILDFDISQEYWNIISKNDLFIANCIISKSNERIREELYKMFICNTEKSMQLFTKVCNIAPNIHSSIFGRGNLWLVPTLQKK